MGHAGGVGDVAGVADVGDAGVVVTLVTPMTWNTALPIDEALPALHDALASRAVAVLEAPPGAGKTTRVPLSLLAQPWLGAARIVMLEPRRLAARAAAHFMARTIREPVGQTVGYRVRGDSRVSSRTRIEVITEGVLTRMLARDATLDGIGAVIFDEFHERSLLADLGLALTLHTRDLLRDDLRLLVMSATLDGNAVAELLRDAHGAAPVIRSRGRMFPVATHYRGARAQEQLEAHASRVVREALQAHEGDVLVFLPGAREIRRTASLLNASLPNGSPLNASGATVVVHELFGMMPLAAQDAAIAPAPHGERKVVLATSIAETSLTIEGVRVVVDGGKSRLPRYDARVGLSRLTTVRVSRASADQRRGRAGRVAEGFCYRLWDAHEDPMMPPATRAEILDADLTPLALELAEAGVDDAASLRWLDQPSPALLQQSRSLLTLLGALDDNRRITKHGREMVSLPLHPRLAHMLLHATTRGVPGLGAAVAACLEERDFLRGTRSTAPADLQLRVELVQGASTDALHHALNGAVVDRDGLQRARELARELLRELTRGVGRSDSRSHSSDDSHEGSRENPRDISHTGSREASHEDIAVLAAKAYPDRIAQQRAIDRHSAPAEQLSQRKRYLMRNGVGAKLETNDSLYGATWLAIAEVDGTPPEYRILRAVSISLESIRSQFSQQIREERVITYDEDANRLIARRQTCLGELVLDDAPLGDVRPEERADVLLQVVHRRGLTVLSIGRSATQLRERLAFLHRHDAQWPDISDAMLIAESGTWLHPLLLHARSLADVGEQSLVGAWLERLTWSQRAALDQLAPTHIEVPSGSRIAIDYSQPDAPILSVKLQEVFGWSTTPLIHSGRVPLTLHLLSPAQRPVQVTRDLAGFWREGYFAVRKELRGRYPRHPWPEDPISALATRRAKPRGT